MTSDTACKIEWITIPAPNLDAAKTFYAACFDFTCKHFNDRFVVFKAGNLSGGFDQDLAVSEAGIGFSVSVSSVSKAIALVLENGGAVLREPYELAPGAGYCAKFRDPNGNAIELFSIVL